MNASNEIKESGERQMDSGKRKQTSITEESRLKSKGAAIKYK